MGSKIKAIFGILLLLGILAVERAASEEPFKGNGTRRYTEEFYNTIFALASCCGIFKTFNLEDMKNWVDGISTWEAPKELEQKFPFYQAGYDADNKPVWVIEFGKYNFKEQVRQGTVGTTNLEKYLYQSAITALEVGMMSNGTVTKNITQGLAILDSDKFDLSQFTHGPTLMFLSNTFRTYAYLLDAALSKVILINAPFPADFVTKFAAGIFGPLVKKIEVYGRRNKWEPLLKKLIPDKSLPAWYGGSKDFKPVKVYG